MTKVELTRAVADREGVTFPVAEAVVDGMINVISANLRKGERIMLTGLGRFYTIRTKPRKARNPRTGEDVHVPAKTKVRFAASDKLRSALNGN